MIIALIPNSSKHQARSIAIGILEFLAKEKIKVVVEDSEAEALGAEKLSSVNPKKVDYVISLGGDGTLLGLFHRFPELEAPIFGVNLGSLGFLAEVPVSEIYPSLEELIRGKCHVQERMVIKGETYKNETCHAVNDIVIHRGQNPNIIDFALHVNGKYLNTFSADGVIISTPGGSTAYSLAAGGPIVTPDLDALVITPISPHTISNRPLVMTADCRIEIQLLSEVAPVEISNDGKSHFHLSIGEVFTVSQSDRVFRLVSLKRHDYFSTLRTKLGWAGKMRA